MTDSEALYRDHERAYISIPDAGNINPNAIVHEVLHLHRYWVEAIPQMDAVNDVCQDVELMTSIDNTLEHLMMVPQERDMATILVLSGRRLFGMLSLNTLGPRDGRNGYALRVFWGGQWRG